MNDVEEILKAGPGLDLNLSAAEIAELRSRLQGVSKAERVEAVYPLLTRVGVTDEELADVIMRGELKAYVERLIEESKTTPPAP